VVPFVEIRWVPKVKSNKMMPYECFVVAISYQASEEAILQHAVSKPNFSQKAELVPEDGDTEHR
jgi:hypothetical protein